MKKKVLCMLAAATMMATMLAGCKSSGQEEQSTTENTAEVVTQTESEAVSNEGAENEAVEVTEESAVVRIGAMSGPTAMGMVKLMSDAEAGNTTNKYEFAELSTDASAFVAPLAKGELDIAAVPSNLAATVYNNTEGKIEVLAINNNGVLAVVERGEDVNTLADLAGKTVYATGQGAVPEYSIRYLLSENGIDPDSDVTIQWCSDTTEALSYINNDEHAVAILPQPFVTAACAQVEGLRVAIDLNDEWAALNNGSSMVIGVVVVRKEFAEAHPVEVAVFMDEYAESVAYAKEDVEGAAALIEQYGIVGKAAIAQKALPGCHLSGVTGEEMKNELKGFLQVLYDQNPQSVGGAMPGEDFYFETY